MQILSALEPLEEECTRKDKNKTIAIYLNYRDISSFGYISERFRGVEELYLNHNSIKRLNGIEQFPFLKVLSVKFNMIDSLDQFWLILNRKRLHVLNFAGNPVETNLSATKDFFVQIFPNLVELNDKSIANRDMTDLDIGQTTARQRSAVTPVSIVENLKATSLQKQNMFKEKLDRLSKKISDVSIIERVHSIEKENLDDNKVGIKITQRTMVSQDLSYILTDHNNMFDSHTLNNQKTATFAQVQALAHKNAQIRNSILDDDRFVTPQLTERFIDYNRTPFLVDQSQIVEQASFQAKSIDTSVLRNALFRQSTTSRVNYTDRILDTGNDVSRSDAKGKLDYSIMSLHDQHATNLFDKHILNIYKDIDDLAQTFYQKSLKERVLKALVNNAEIDKKDDIDRINFNKAKQFWTNLRLIRVFYAWVFYMNTNRRKTALINAINLSTKSASYDTSSPTERGSLSSQTHRERSNLSKEQLTQGSLNGKKTKRYNYCLSEEFE